MLLSLISQGGDMFKHKFYAYFSETDMAGIVHFSNFLRYVEKAEEEFIRSLGKSFYEIIKSGYGFPRLEVKCRYLSPIRCGDEVEVRLRVGEVKSKTLRYDFEIYNLTTDKKAAEGYLVVIYMDLKNWKVLEIPKEFIEQLKEVGMVKK